MRWVELFPAAASAISSGAGRRPGDPSTNPIPVDAVACKNPAIGEQSSKYNVP